MWRPRPWGQGPESASHPCLRLSSRPRGGRSPGNSSGWLLSTAGERRLAPVTASRAADRQSRFNVTPPRFTRAGTLHERTAANRVTAGRDSLPNTARPQCEAPLTAPAVVGASPCDATINSPPRSPHARRERRSLQQCFAGWRVVVWASPPLSKRLPRPRPALAQPPSPAGVAEAHRDRHGW